MASMRRAYRALPPERTPLTRVPRSASTLASTLRYLTIKGMAPIAEDVIIVTSSLTKDMTGKEEVR